MLSWYDNLLRYSSTRIFLYSVINSIICVILAKSFRSYADEFDDFLPFLQFVNGVEEEKIEEIGNGSEFSNSRSNEEDNDDSGSDGEIGWIDDDEEFDKRVEEFISKVINGWMDGRKQVNLLMDIKA